MPESELDYMDNVREQLKQLAVNIALERALAAEDVNKLRERLHYARFPDEFSIMARKRWAQCDIATANMEIEMLNLQRALESVTDVELTVTVPPRSG